MNTYYYAVLKLDSFYLSLEELKALLNYEEKISYFTGVAIFEKWKDGVSLRSSTIKRAGRVIKISNDPKEINEEIRGECYTINVDSIRGFGKEKLKENYEEITKGIKLSKKCRELDLIFTDGTIIAGLVIEKRDSKSLERHSKRPFKQSGTMDSSTARLLVNISRPRKLVLDPFCGTGSLLIEASWLGYNCIGSDISAEMINKSKLNLNYFGYNCELLQSSALNLGIRSVDAIATDPPYGRSSASKGANLRELYEKFFSEANNILCKECYLVFSTSHDMDWRDILKSVGFREIKIHYLYSHKSLTRAIYVVKK
ncbi:MAG: TRM11 family methyltransferase [Sulfolobaceae archaeon]